MQVFNMGPGSGKTTLALDTISNVIQKNYSCVYMTITNSAVNDARQRFMEKYKSLGKEFIESKLEVSTMHSYAIQELRPQLAGQFNVKLMPTLNARQATIQVPTIKEIFEAEEEKRIDEMRAFFVENLRRIPTRDGEKVLQATFDQMLPMYALLQLKPKEDKVLVIDEYQDLALDEVTVLARSFGKNALLFGDLNQYIFGFRMKPENRMSGPFQAMDSHEKVKSHRIPQDACEFINRVLELKRAWLGVEGSPLTVMYSDKSHESVNFNIFEGIGSNVISSRAMKRDEGPKGILGEDIYQLLEKNKGKDDQLVLTFTNRLAIEYSKAMLEIHGEDKVSDLYIKASNHPAYYVLRSICRSHPVEAVRRRNILATAEILKGALNDLGYYPSLLPSEVSLARVDSTQRNRISKNGEKVWDTEEARKRAQMMASALKNKKGLPEYYQIGKGKYTMESERRALINLIMAWFNEGFGSAFMGLHYQLKNPKGKIRIFTLHGAKGLEADVVYLHVSPSVGGGRSTPTIATVRDLFAQMMNLIYVGVSRHKQTLEIIMPEEMLDTGKYNQEAVVEGLTKPFEDNGYGNTRVDYRRLMDANVSIYSLLYNSRSAANWANHGKPVVRALVEKEEEKNRIPSDNELFL